MVGRASKPFVPNAMLSDCWHRLLDAMLDSHYFRGIKRKGFDWRIFIEF